MIEQEQDYSAAPLDYLDVAKEFLDKAQGRGTSLPEALAQIAIAAAMIALIERLDDEWRITPGEFGTFVKRWR